MESYKHRFAKNAVAGWLRAQYDTFPRPESWKVFTEYPICVDSENHLRGLCDIWAECGEYAPNIPTYQQCLDVELLPLVIFDVVVFYKGQLADVYEIVHTSDISKEKTQNLVRIDRELFGLDLWLLDAAWVLSRPERPFLPPAGGRAWCVPTA